MVFLILIFHCEIEDDNLSIRPLGGIFILLAMSLGSWVCSVINRTLFVVTRLFAVYIGDVAITVIDIQMLNKNASDIVTLIVDK